MKKISVPFLVLCIVFFGITSYAEDAAKYNVVLETVVWDYGSIDIPVLSGLEDIELQNAINERIRDTFAERVEKPDPPNTVEGTAEWHIFADRYLSVLSTYYYSGTAMAHPWADIRTLTFDLQGDDTPLRVSDVILVDEDLRVAIRDGVFRKANDPIDIEGSAADFIIGYIDEYNPETTGYNFYFTEDGIALYLNDRPHAAGDFWVFEAAFTDIELIVNPDFSY